METSRPVDPRIRRTRETLELALRQLIEERDLVQLSATDVIRCAGVSRSTFYDHFADLQELAGSACTSMFDVLLASTPVVDSRSMYELGNDQNPLTTFFEHILEHRRLYIAVLGPNGSAFVEHHLQRRLTAAIYVNRMIPDASSTHADDPDRTPHDVAAAFAAGALLGVIKDWIDRDCVGSTTEMAQKTWPLLNRLSESVCP